MKFPELLRSRSIRFIGKVCHVGMTAVLILAVALSGAMTPLLQADTLYKANSGANSTLDTALFTPAAPGALIQNYAEATAFTTGDIIVFNNLITAATTFRVSAVNAANLAVGGLTIGSLLNGALLNPGGAITISNSDNQSQTITLGSSGIDLAQATQNLTFANATGGTMTVGTSANQTWTLRTGRILSLAAAPLNLAHNVTLQGAGTVALGNATVGNAISGSGNLNAEGAQSGGASVVTLSGNNNLWTGAVTVGSASALRGAVQLNLDQLAAGQNKLADARTLTINHSTVNLQGTLGGTETVAGVSLGQGLNAILRSAGTGVLQANSINFATGAGLNVGNIGLIAASSHLTTDNLNNNLILGTRLVAINGSTDSNWVKNATGAADGAVIAASGTDYTTQNTLNSWTDPTQNILMTATGVASTASRQINSLKIAHATAATAVTVDIGAGNTLTLNDGFNGGGIIRNQTGVTTIGNATVGAGNLTAGGQDDSINDTLYIWNSQGTLTIANVIQNNNTGIGTDTLHLFTGGAGTTTIAADNTYTGGTTIAAGVLAIGANVTAHDNADLGSGDIVNHGTLVLSKTVGATLAQTTLANNITGTGAFTINRGVATLSGVNDFSGITTVSAATTLRAGSVTGISANSRMLLNLATAVLDLNTYDSSVAALRGDVTSANVALGLNTLTLSGSDLANSGSAEVLSLVSQGYQGGFTGAGNLIKNGNYTQIFTVGGVAAYTGATTVNGGLLQTNKVLASAALTVNNLPNLFGSNSTFLSNVANSLAATAAVNLTQAGSIWMINNGFDQTIGSLAGGTDSRLLFGPGASDVTVTVIDNGVVPTIFDGIIGVTPGAGNTNVVKDGSNTWVLGGGNSYTGSTTIRGGIIQLSASAKVGILSDQTAVILADTAGVALDLNGRNTSFGSLAGGGSTGGLVTLGSTGRMTIGTNNGSTNFAGAISGGSASAESLVKVGNGTMILSGANTFLGDVLIRRGTGGITLSGGSALADTANIRNFGNGSTLTIIDSETVGAVSGAAGTNLVLGAGATLTTSYTNGAPVVGAATADVDPLAGRVIKDIDTTNLSPGMLISGGTIPAGAYIVQILDGNSVLINAVPTPLTTNFAATTSSVSVLASNISGAGGFTKNGSGLLFMSGSSSYTGDTTLNEGTIQIGGIWTGRGYSIQDQLSDGSQFVFAGTGTQNLNFANSATNLIQYERIGSLAGGSITSTINLVNGSSTSALAIGGDNSSSTFSGRIVGASSATWLIKEGSGTFTWNNPTAVVADMFDGTIVVDGGGFTISGINGLDTTNNLLLQNNGSIFTSNVSVSDSFAVLQGGGRGAGRVLPNGIVGGSMSNYVAGGEAQIVLGGPLVRLITSSAISSVYGGNISGAGIFQKDGTSTLELRGTGSGSYQTIFNGGILRMGAYGGGTGLGAPGLGGFGSLNVAGNLRGVAGTLDLNNSDQTTIGFGSTSTGGTLAIGNGALTFTNQSAQTVATVLTANLDGRWNINGSAALALTGNNTGFGGTINLGGSSSLNLNRSGGALNSTGLPAARVNLNSATSQLTITLADTIGSLSGAGSAVLTQALTLREAASGSTSAAPFTGVTSGAGELILSNFGGLTVTGNLAHSGGTNLNSGSSLNLNYGAGNNILPGTGALTLNGATIRVNRTEPTAAILESVASLSLNAGASRIIALNGPTGAVGSGTGGINLNAMTRATGGTIDFGRNAAATSSANVNGILGGVNSAYATFEGSTWAVSNGATAAITGLSTFNADTFVANQHTDINLPGVNPGGTAATLRFSGANAADITGPTTLSQGGILVTRGVGANASTISGALSSTGNELIFHQYNPLGDLIIANVGGTNTAITTAGGGRTLLTGAIAGTGTTTLGYGYLQLGDNSAGGSATGMVGTGLIRNDGTLAVNRSNAQVFAAILSGTGNFEQLGSGTTTLSAANTFAGRVTVRGGTLEITDNAGLGQGSASPLNRWANFTSVNTGGTLLFNVAAGGTVSETLNLDGGTVEFRSALASTLTGPILLSRDSTIHLSNAGTAVSHLITGEISGLPGSDLTITGVATATSTLVLAPAAATGARWENTTIESNGRLQIGNNTRGFLGSGNIVNNGELILNTNDAHYVVDNVISGTGNLTLVRNNTYLTADNTYTGTTTIGSVAQNAVMRVGNDTYTGSTGSGAITVQSSVAGNSQIRYHLIQDSTIANTITLNPNSNGATAAYNADFVKDGLGTLTFTGTINGGIHAGGPNTQRAQITASTKMIFAGTLNSPVGSEVNLAVNAPFAFAGGISNTWNGVLSGGGPFIFRNSGTTTLSGINTFTANSYIDSGIVTLSGGAASNDDVDWYVNKGATLNIVTTETIGALYGQSGSTVNVASGQTLTIDDTVAQGMNGTFTGAGNLVLAGGNYLSMQGATNTMSGSLTLNNGTVRSNNLTNAIGSFTGINLGSGTNAGNLEYVGDGETFSSDLFLGTGTGGARITSTGRGALVLSGSISSISGVKTLQLTGQTGGAILPAAVVNRVDGAITEGTGTLSIATPATANDDRFGVTSRWALTNKNNDFSGGITVNTGNLEIGGILNDGGVGLGGLGNGTGATSSMGDLTAVRTIDLGTNNYDGRRYDSFGGSDQLTVVAAGIFTSTLIPSGSTGTLIFNDPNAGTATLGSNITFTQSFNSTTNPGGAQIRNIGTKQIVINGNLTSGATGNRTWTLDGSNILTNTIGGNISNGSTAIVAVSKEGSGTWRLSGANTNTGTVTVARGILEVSGGNAISDSNTVAVTGAGSDGLATGPAATFRVVGSETIGLLTGNIGTLVEINSGQTLTIAAGNSTFNGVITGAGNLTRTVNGATAGTLISSDKNSYTGITTIGAVGAATASAGLTIYQLDNGGAASGLGASSNAASNLVFVSNTANNQGGVLSWQGYTNQSTDRLFTMGLGSAAARINAIGAVLTAGALAPRMTFSNTGALAFTGSGARTLTLGGSTLTDNEFRPQLTDGGGLTSLSKVDGGLWLINPGALGNTYTGGTTITLGTLAIQAGNALGTGLLTINGGSGTGLELRGGVTLTNNLTNLVAGGGLRASSGSNVLTGVLTAGVEMRVGVDAGASLEFSHATTSLVGAGALRKIGEGTLILSGGNTSTGAAIVNSGILQLEYGINNGSKLADASPLTLGGILGLAVPGFDSGVSGVTNIAGGSGGKVNLSGGSHLEIVSATTIDTGSNAVTRTSGTGVLRMNLITRGNSQGTIDFGAANIAQTDSNNVNGILGGYATVAKTDWASSIATGAADTAITALATYSTDLYGTGLNSNITLATATTGAATLTNSFRFNANQATTLTLGAAFGVQGTAVGLQSGGILVTPNVGAFATVINGAPLQNALATLGLEAAILHQHNTLGALQIDSVIQNNTLAIAQALTKTGAGNVFLNALNTFTGAVNLYEGGLQVGGTAALPGVATDALLGGGNNALNLGFGTTLRFNTSNLTAFNTGVINGDGDIIIDSGVVLFDDANDSTFYGNLTVNGGTVQVGAQNNALGNVRGTTSFNNTVGFTFNSAITTPEIMNYSEGTTLNVTSLLGGTFSGRQNFANTTAAGMTFNIGSPTTVTTVGLNITGIINGTNGFTKTGDGILQLSANNFADAYDGYTSINRSPTLLGQVRVDAGILYVGGTRALGAFGVGNETVIASGATVDLRDADLNLGDDSSPNREIFKIIGTGVNGTGALRNTVGTALISFLTLDGSATISNGGFANASRLDLATFDTNVNNASLLEGNLIRNRPVIEGNNFDLTLRSGSGFQAVVFHDPQFSSALKSITIAEGVLRLENDVPPRTAWAGLTGGDVTNGITLAYAGPSLGDQTNAALGTGPIVGSRLTFFRNSDLHHTVAITMDGITSGANGGKNVIDILTDTIPGVRTYLDGSLSLLGAAGNNIIQSESGGNFSVQEQGNLTAGLRAKLIVGGVMSGSGGFTKTGFGEVRLTNNNTFTGDVNILRFGTTAIPWQSNIVQINGVNFPTYGDGEGWNEWGLTLSGVNGALSGVGNINLQRRGMITLDNTSRLDPSSGSVFGGNNNDRINNAATINFNDGWVRVHGGSVNNTESFGTVNLQSGTNFLDLYPTDGAGTNMTLTIAQLNRAAGSVLRINNLDATSTFSTAAVGESVRVALTSSAGLTQVGGGGAPGSVTRDIVLGVFGGNVPYDLLTSDLRLLGYNNANISDLANQQRNLQFLAGSHFMTVDGGFLRPLDDSEYFDTTDSLLNPATATGKNVSVNGINTLMSLDTTVNSLRFGPLTDHNNSGGAINSSTSLTGLNDHFSVSLYVDGTLSITSGMISSAYFTMGNSNSLVTIIQGGNLNFGTREAIINNQNGTLAISSGAIVGGSLEIRSNISGSGGLLKTGSQRVTLDGQNTYSGITTINDGELFVRSGRTGLGLGGLGNGVVITGNGNLNTGNGVQIGSATAREDIYVGVLNGDNQIMRTDNDVTNWFSNVTIDNVDLAGMVIGTPRIRADASATAILNGNLFGGNTPITNDVVVTDSRRLTLQGAGNNVIIVRGQIGDKSDAAGNAIPIADPISTLPTVAGLRTNENEVLRVDVGGGTFESNIIMERQYNAAGRLTIEAGNLIIAYDPTAVGNDGNGFWTETALSRIPNADATTTSFAVNGGTTFQGFQLGTVSGTIFNNGTPAVLMTRNGQAFNLATWSTVGTGVTKVIGGLNESGTVTYGNGTGTLTHNSSAGQLYAASGGRVVFNQVMLGSPGTAPANLGFTKIGRGTVELQSTTLNTASTSTFELGGGTLILNHDGGTGARVGSANATFSGGSLQAWAGTAANSTANLATDNAVSVLLRYNLGNSEILARTTNTGIARNMLLNLGNANANGTTATSNLTRALGATANFVEDSSAGGAAQITMNFNAATSALVKNAAIPWATYGTAARTATDFAMVDGNAGNDLRAFGRAGDENVNAVASWTTGMDVSENGGAGFNGSLAGNLTLNTMRFDAAADSVVDLGTNVLTLAGPGLAQSAGAILVSSNVGSANKTIRGGVGSALTSTGGLSELIIHQYSTGNLNLETALTGTINLTINGPSTVDAATIGTSGAVILSGANTYNGRTIINGAALSFNDVNQLGLNPGAAAADRLTLNGGTLRFSGRGFADLGNRGLRFEGSGGTIDVVEASATLRTDSISSQGIYRGDLIKVGAGTLGIEGILAANAGFTGLIDVREGTLRLAGNNPAANAGASSLLGTSNSYADGTIMRTGTNLAIQMGNANDAASTDWSFDEWITFEGNNYVTVGTIATQIANTSPVGFPTQNNERPVNLNGILTIQGATTFDVVQGQMLRTNLNGVGYITGNGDLIKDGQGTMELRGNVPDFTGNLTVLQGRLMGLGQADVFGTGYLTGKTVTLGSAYRQGTAEFAINSESAIHNWAIEINHDINVVYNPTQAKRLTVETVANGMRIDLNGTITLNDNLNFYMNDGAEVGGSQNYVNLNGSLRDGLLTSGNITFHGDDTGSANDNTTGRPYNYAVLNADNSLWTGDVHISANTSYDQDQTTILRLGHLKALGEANDVTMNYNSILQIGGGARTIGSLVTNGGVGPFLGGRAGGTMGASTNGSTEIIENAAATAGTLTITQSTPGSAEVFWDAHFRDGTLNSQFLAPGAGLVPSAALNLIKAGGGWATLTMDNAYTGTTGVTAGTLQVGRLGVGDTGAAGISGTRFTAAVGTSVAGTGVIQGNALIEGFLRPGDEAGGAMGTLLFNGNLTLGSTAMASLQLQRASYTAMNALNIHDSAYGTWNAGHPTDALYSHLLDDPITTAQHDKLAINGTFTVLSGGKFSLLNQGYNPTAGDIINLADWNGIALSLNLGGVAYNGGTFRSGGEAGTDLNLFELGNGLMWDVSQFNTTGNLLVVEATTRQFFWRGEINSSWNTNNAGDTNWSTSLSGATDPGTLPAFTDEVFFTTTTAGNFSTQLGADVAIRRLTLGGGANATNSVMINTGANELTLYGGGLTQTVTSAANLITGTGGIILAVDQTWTNDSSNTLTVSAPVRGESNLTKAGVGTLILSGANTYSGNTTVSTGTLQLGNGGTTGTLAPASSISVASGATFAVARSNAVVQGTDFSGTAISGGGGFTQAGSGTTTLNAANSYTGATRVDNGMLMVNGNQSAATGAVTVASGATLGGTGTIGDLTSSATIASGGTLTGGNDGSSGTVGVLNPLVTDAVGTLSFGGNLTAASGSIWLVDLVQGVSGTADRIDVGGALGLAGSNLAINFGGAFVQDQVYTIASYGLSSSGIFSGLTEGAFVDPGNLYRISYGSGGAGGAITLTAVPEPGTLAFLGLALAGLFTRRLRQRRAQGAKMAAGEQ